MVGKQTTLNFYIKRKSDDDGGNTSKKAKTSESWQVCDDGGLIIFTTDGVESRSKVLLKIGFKIRLSVSSKSHFVSYSVKIKIVSFSFCTLMPIS